MCHALMGKRIRQGTEPANLPPCWVLMADAGDISDNLSGHGATQLPPPMPVPPASGPSVA